MEALEAAVSHAVDSSLPKETLKAVLEAALDPKRLPETYGIRSAVSPLSDASLPTYCIDVKEKQELQGVAAANFEDITRCQSSCSRTCMCARVLCGFLSEQDLCLGRA